VTGGRLLTGIAVACAILCGAARAQEPVTVFAAASLKTALDDIADAYSKETGVTFHLSYAGSSALARQIEYGAPANIFVSANADWMDAIEAQDLLAHQTRRNLLTNRLVLIAPAAAKTRAISLSADTDLVQMLAGGRLALALVRAVPAGIYAREALTALGLWESVQDKIAQTDNARAALRLVAMGEAPLGIVYATDARAESRVSVVAPIDPALHSEITYSAAILKEGDTPTARDFLSYLQGHSAQSRFAGHGFLPLEASE